MIISVFLGLFLSILFSAQALSTLYQERLKCRANCVSKLGDFREDRREDFFGVYFHYLQQGYFYSEYYGGVRVQRLGFKVHFTCVHPLANQSLQALQSSAAHSRLEPTNEAAQRNSVFYLQQPGVTRKDFKPREVRMCGLV